jgi:hypothetical protein
MPTLPHPASTADLDTELRLAVRQLMSGNDKGASARIQEILFQKAALARAPIEAKIRRIRASV